MRLLHLHLHGLFRSRDLELGRDADTGGQTLYVLDLVRSLALRPEVEQVDVVTRLIQDRRVDVSYSQPVETIAPGARILRLPFGPKRYLRKEQLWPHLEDLADQLVQHLTQPGKRVDWIHAHYADAGFVGALVSQRLGIPLVFTGHSLGREKQRRLLAGGGDRQQIEQAYAISRRIEAEEQALAQADLVITSTRQEADHQYSRYGQFRRERAEVVPPGVDASRFHPQGSSEEQADLNQLFQPFLRDPGKPPLLAISRAVRRKNIPALVEAFGRSTVLRNRYNRCWCRWEDPRQLDKQQRDVFQQVFDLWIAITSTAACVPQATSTPQVPAFYRWPLSEEVVRQSALMNLRPHVAGGRRCGLPMVSTDDGGPRDIQARCDNGLLADVTDAGALQEALNGRARIPSVGAVGDNGIEAVSRFQLGCPCLPLSGANATASAFRRSGRFPYRPRSQPLLLLDLDSNLELPDSADLAALRAQFQRDEARYGLGIVTGRSLAAARQRYADLHLPLPKVWISRAGSEIHHGEQLSPDRHWQRRIDADWDRQGVLAALADLQDQLKLQDPQQQGPWKVSYLLRQPDASLLDLVRQRLRRAGLQAQPLLRCHWYLDVLPRLASRSEAIRHLALHWQLPLERVLLVASQQGDAELLRGMPAAVVPADHDPCLQRQPQQQRVFFSTRPSLGGVLDGLSHFRFPSSR